MGTLALLQRKGQHKGLKAAMTKHNLPKSHKLLWQKTGHFGEDWREAHINILLFGKVQVKLNNIIA